MAAIAQAGHTQVCSNVQSTDGMPVASDTLRSMRDAARADIPVPAHLVGEWFRALREQLFTDQRPVRLEQNDPGSPYWIQIDERQWHQALRRKINVRALYVHPLPGERRRRAHTWAPDQTHCTACHDSFEWAGAYCLPPTPPEPMMTKVQPFNPRWVLPLLDRLELAMKRESKRERDKWHREINLIRRSIDENTKEAQP